MFEILVSGIARTYRNTEGMAIDTGKILRGRDKSEITVINQDTRQWLVIVDPYGPAPVWKQGPTALRQIGS